MTLVLDAGDTTEPFARRRAQPRRFDVTELVPLLDRVEAQLSRACDDALRTREQLDELFLTLAAGKAASTPSDWEAIVARCRGHAVCRLLHQDPFTGRAFEKPRGYAGDACMMDFIYGVEDGGELPPTSPAGRAVYDYLSMAPACQGVRSRRAVVAAYIDRLAEERRDPAVLSIAAGHLREANLSVAIRRRRLGRLLALDSDAESLAVVRAAYGHLGVETSAASFRQLLNAGHLAGEFDLVYSTGLFDYLSQRTGRRLVHAMHRMLRPGGSLLVANFLPAVRDIGYMEAFMDWKLVYRARHDMIDLTRDLPEAELKHVELWSEEALNIIFLRVTRT